MSCVYTSRAELNQCLEPINSLQRRISRARMWTMSRSEPSIVLYYGILSHKSSNKLLHPSILHLYLDMTAALGLLETRNQRPNTVIYCSQHAEQRIRISDTSTECLSRSKPVMLTGVTFYTSRIEAGYLTSGLEYNPQSDLNHQSTTTCLRCAAHSQFERSAEKHALQHFFRYKHAVYA